MVTDTVSGRGVLSVNEFLRFANIGRTKLYQEIAAGRLTVRKIGRKTVIAAPDAYTWLDSLPARPSLNSVASQTRSPLQRRPVASTVTSQFRRGRGLRTRRLSLGRASMSAPTGDMLLRPDLN
jgi:hypothetical protein